MTSEATGLHSRWGFGVLGVLVLSLGIGSATAAFSVIDVLMPHAASYPTCDAIDAAVLADRSLFAMLSVAALALLVACANAARVLYDRGGLVIRSTAATRIALATIGALSIATVLVHLLSTSSPSEALGAIPTVRLDARAMGFAVSVSALAETSRRIHSRLT